MAYNTGSSIPFFITGGTGNITTTGDINITDGSKSLFTSAVKAYSYLTYQSKILLDQRFINTTISSLDFSQEYIGFPHPTQISSLSIASKYFYIQPKSDGNFSMYINNIASRVLQSDWTNLVLKTDYNFQCLGKYNYIEHNQTNNICGHWSNRTGTGGPTWTSVTNWVCLGGMENNNGTPIGTGYPNAFNGNRVFTWMIENSSGTGKSLGLCCNRIDSPNSYINTASQDTAFQLIGFFAPNRLGYAFSFTGQHSSMVCDDEYEDIMNLNTDDFIGMVVCSSGKIYNLPYDCDGNTYEKQVDNIKAIDSQPMSRLSKKYKDKAVLGVISHIEQIGKDRNDLGTTSWTGCMALDIDERRRIRVASIGEGGIWITNEFGNIENGDYITSSNIPGYSTKQDDDLMHNYTIGKAVMDCEFDIEKPDEYKTKYLGNGIYASYIACTFHCG